MLSFTATDVITFKVYLNTFSINGGGTGSLFKGVKKFFKHSSYNANTQVSSVNAVAVKVRVNNPTLLTRRLPCTAMRVWMYPLGRHSFPYL